MSEANQAIKKEIAHDLHEGKVPQAKNLIRILPSPKTDKPAERLAAEKRGAEILAKLRAKILSLKK